MLANPMIGLRFGDNRISDRRLRNRSDRIIRFGSHGRNGRTNGDGLTSGLDLSLVNARGTAARFRSGFASLGAAPGIAALAGRVLRRLADRDPEGWELWSRYSDDRYELPYWQLSAWICWSQFGIGVEHERDYAIGWTESQRWFRLQIGWLTLVLDRTSPPLEPLPDWPDEVERPTFRQILADAWEARRG